jgi:uncharacterized protein (TIGR00297 family)
MLKSILAHAWGSSPERFLIAAAVTVGFAALARILHGVNRSGAVAGGFACLLLFAGAGPAAFATLAALFLITWIATRLGHRRKVALGLAEPPEGRNAWQVLANLGIAAVGSLLFGLTGNRAWLVAMTAALSEAATDTVASEIGQYYRPDSHLITTWKPVPAGTDGGVTVAGCLAGLSAGILITITTIAAGGGLLPYRQFWIPAMAGFAGMLFDSLLGATLQRRGSISNQMVNLCATAAAATLAYGISELMLT